MYWTYRFNKLYIDGFREICSSWKIIPLERKIISHNIFLVESLTVQFFIIKQVEIWLKEIKMIRKYISM
jgi:hypothetical protein